MKEFSDSSWSVFDLCAIFALRVGVNTKKFFKGNNVSIELTNTTFKCKKKYLALFSVKCDRFWVGKDFLGKKFFFLLFPVYNGPNKIAFLEDNIIVTMDVKKKEFLYKLKNL